MTARTDTFGIALPPDWVRFPLENGDFESFARIQRNRLRREGSMSRTSERQFEVLMRGLRNDCESTGIRMIATLLAFIHPEADADEVQSDTTEEDSNEPQLAAASMTIAVVDQAQLGSDVPLTVNAILVAMNLESQSDEEGGSREQISNLEAPSIMEMPVGKVVRVVRLYNFRRFEDGGVDTRTGELSMFVQHFFVPIDEDGVSAALVTFSTPMFSLAGPMSDLFEAMMETFEMFAGDEITDPGQLEGR